MTINYNTIKNYAYRDRSNNTMRIIETSNNTTPKRNALFALVDKIVYSGKEMSFSANNFNAFLEDTLKYFIELNKPVTDREVCIYIPLIESTFKHYVLPHMKLKDLKLVRKSLQFDSEELEISKEIKKLINEDVNEAIESNIVINNLEVINNLTGLEESFKKLKYDTKAIHVVKQKFIINECNKFLKLNKPLKVSLYSLLESFGYLIDKYDFSESMSKSKTAETILDDFIINTDISYPVIKDVLFNLTTYEPGSIDAIHRTRLDHYYPEPDEDEEDEIPDYRKYGLTPSDDDEDDEIERPSKDELACKCKDDMLSGFKDDTFNLDKLVDDYPIEHIIDSAGLFFDLLLAKYTDNNDLRFVAHDFIEKIIYITSSPMLLSRFKFYVDRYKNIIGYGDAYEKDFETRDKEIELDIEENAKFLKYVNKEIDLINEVSTAKAVASSAKRKAGDAVSKVRLADKRASKTIDTISDRIKSNIDLAVRSDRRENIIRGKILPSTSKMFKIVLGLGGLAFVNPYLAIIAAVAGIAHSKKVNKREKLLILDEIEIELEITKKKLNAVDPVSKDYEKLLRIKKKLELERTRIKYNIKTGSNLDR